MALTESYHVPRALVSLSQHGQSLAVRLPHDIVLHLMVPHDSSVPLVKLSWLIVTLERLNYEERLSC